MLAVKKKMRQCENTSLRDKRNLTNTNVQKLKVTQSELINAYQKE